MMSKVFCPYCMKPTEGKICSHCAKSLDYAARTYHLPLATILSNDKGEEYLIGAALSQGSFNITYAALSLKNNQLVAIKEYFPHMWVKRTEKTVVVKPSQEENFANVLEKSIKEHSKLADVGQMPTVVKILDSFKDNGTAYLVMEYVEGKSLEQVVKEQGKIPAEDFLPMLPKLLDDLEILHSVEIFHSDISPDNIILMPNGQLKLLGFGFKHDKIVDNDSSGYKETFYPIEYYSDRMKQGAFTDVYFICGTIYYCLTGTMAEFALKRIFKENDDLTPPNTLGAGLTKRKEAALIRGLGLRPNDRWQSIQSFREAFGPFEIPEPIPPEPVGIETENTGETDTVDTSLFSLDALKNPKILAAAVTVVAALALLLGFFAGL